MTNAEKRGKEILEQECRTGNWALNKYTNEICNCTIGKCRSCMFFDGDWACTNVKAKWLNGEYVEKKHFTEADKDVLRALDKVQWVARDKDGKLFAYATKPFRNMTGYWYSASPESMSRIDNLSTAEFAPVKWEDDKPTSRAEILGEDEK